MACTDTGDGQTYQCPIPDGLAPGEQMTARYVVAFGLDAVPETSMQMEVHVPGDVRGADDVGVRVFPVTADLEPTAALAASRTLGPVPMSVEFDGSGSLATGPDTQYLWNFGDGVTAQGATVAHDYTRSGVYLATLTVVNGTKRDTATRRIIVAPDEPLVAVAGDPVTAEEGIEVAFDGSASRPYQLIESYRWDFGDGSTAVGKHVAHTYSEPGDYEATLTVRVGTATASAVVPVRVLPVGSGGPPGAGLVIQVEDNAAKPLRVADVAVVDRNGTRTTAVTDATGRAVLRNLANGPYTVYAYKLGYQPNRGQARVVNGSGAGKIVLAKGDVGAVELEHRRLTLEEIVAAGIDITDPANRNVIEVEIEFRFEVPTTEEEPEPEEFPSFMISGEGGIFVNPPIAWECNDELDAMSRALGRGRTHRRGRAHRGGRHPGRQDPPYPRRRAAGSRSSSTSPSPW